MLAGTGSGGINRHRKRLVKEDSTMAKPLRVLLVEDQSSDAEMTLLELRLAGLDPQSTVVADEADYRKGLTGDPEIIICDHYLPTFDSIRALEILKDSRRDIPFNVVSGAIREDEAVECMKRGAADYLLKDRLARLGQAVKHALES